MASARAALLRMGSGFSFLSVASAGAYFSSCRPSSTQGAQDSGEDGSKPLASVIFEQQVTVGTTQASSTRELLASHAREALRRPGLLGAKCLHVHESPKPLVIFVLGGPGAGKGTQCARLVEEYGYEHLSAGDLLRAAQKESSEEGKLIQECIREGKIVPVHITVRLLRRAMQSSPKRRFLIDGFPRNGNNLAGWHQVVGDAVHVGGVLMFDCAEDVLLRRLLERGKSSGRADDNEASIKKRFQTYRAQTMPVVEYYDQLGLVKRVDAAEPVEKVYGAIQDALRPVHDDHARRGGEVRCVLQLFCQDKSAADDYLARTGGIANALPSDGAVRATVASRVLFADESIKPYGLGSVRAFD